MAPDINSPKNDRAAARDEVGDDRPIWTGRLSLTRRILAVNFFALALLAGGFFYLDSYRTRLIDTRLQTIAQEANFLDTALNAASPEARNRLVTEFARESETRVRLYDKQGNKTLDSFLIAPPVYSLPDPATEPWQRQIARDMDRVVDFIVRAPRPPIYHEPTIDKASSWPELSGVSRAAIPTYRFAPDRSPMLSAGKQFNDGSGSLLLTAYGRDITRTVRAERWRLGIVLATAALASLLLSLFLARTIARPLRKLAIAATRVKLGRAREVQVPRLPSRRDEIGMLARALSDMTGALRQRIDAGEHFAADVTHELKNPIASLRSAIEGLERVDDPALRDQLLGIAADDVRRLDRLVTDISEASRVDAQLSRARFEVIDLGKMIEAMLAAREARRSTGAEPQAHIAFARPRVEVACVMGEGHRLERVLDNLIDNALSFTPPDGLVRIAATRVGNDVVVKVVDDGPGIPPDKREEIFHRFHSIRPESEEFGKHSGLGLAIARTIIEGHQGSIIARDRDDGEPGACFEIRLPSANCDGAPVA